MARQPCRTPPGVRELKLLEDLIQLANSRRRTPPGVRELKQALTCHLRELLEVAPLPGCVN